METLESLTQTGRVPRGASQIVQLATRMLRPRRIWLFGSRARGDQRPLSDIDMAFELDALGGGSWPAFVCEVEEQPFTLLGVDLVDVDRCDPLLAKQIRLEGLLIYERQ